MSLASNNHFLKWAGWVVLAILVKALIVLAFAPPRMPSYQGRSAERWLRSVFSSSATGNSQTTIVSAFREMGTDGVNFLVETLDRKPTSGSRVYERIFYEFPLEVRQWLPEPLDADTLANAASLVLMNIHDDFPARTFPRLVHLLSAENPRTRLHCATVVQHYASNYPELNFGPYRPELIRALQESNAWTRILIAHSLLSAHLNGPEIKDSLSLLLTNSNQNIRELSEKVIQATAITFVPTNHHAP